MMHRRQCGCFARFARFARFQFCTFCTFCTFSVLHVSHTGLYTGLPTNSVLWYPPREVGGSSPPVGPWLYHIAQTHTIILYCAHHPSPFTSFAELCRVLRSDFVDIKSLLSSNPIARRQYLTRVFWCQVGYKRTYDYGHRP